MRAAPAHAMVALAAVCLTNGVSCLQDDVFVPVATESTIELYPIQRDLRSITPWPGADGRFLLEAEPADIAVIVPLDQPGLRLLIEEPGTPIRRQGDRLLWNGPVARSEVALVRELRWDLRTLSLADGSTTKISFDARDGDALTTPDGSWLVTESFLHSIRMWRVANEDAEELGDFPHWNGWWIRPDGTHLVRIRRNTVPHQLIVDRLQEGTQLIHALPFGYQFLAFGPDPTDLLLADETHWAHRMDAVTGEVTEMPLDLPMSRVIWNDRGIQTVQRYGTETEILTLDPSTGATTTEPSPLVRTSAWGYDLLPGLPGDAPVIMRKDRLSTLFDAENHAPGQWRIRATHRFRDIRALAICPDGASLAVFDASEGLLIIEDDGTTAHLEVAQSPSAMCYRAPGRLLLVGRGWLDAIDIDSGAIERIATLDGTTGWMRLGIASDGTPLLGYSTTNESPFARILEDGLSSLEPAATGLIEGLVSFSHPMTDHTGPLAFVYDGTRTNMVLVEDPRTVVDATFGASRPRPVTLHPTRWRLVGLTQAGHELASFPFGEVGE